MKRISRRSPKPQVLVRFEAGGQYVHQAKVIIPWRMTRWEYHVPSAYVIEQQDLSRALNELGKMGWELVCWTDRPIFKRPIEEKSDE